jgi:hypothetical protein
MLGIISYIPFKNYEITYFRTVQELLDLQLYFWTQNQKRHEWIEIYFCNIHWFVFVRFLIMLIAVLAAENAGYKWQKLMIQTILFTFWY